MADDGRGNHRAAGRVGRASSAPDRAGRGSVSGVARRRKRTAKVTLRRQWLGNRPAVRLKRYLLDTGIAADYVNRRGSVYARARQLIAEGARLGLCAPVLGELWDGVFSSATSRFNEALLKRHLGHFAIWPFDYVAALEYGRLAAELRRRGRTIQQIDVQ